MFVDPEAIYEAAVDTGESGLVGVIGLLVVDNQSNVTTPFSTAGIIETPDLSGVYAATRVAPDSFGHYTIVWQLDTGETFGIDELFVGGAEGFVPAPVTSHDYIVAEQLKSTLEMSGLTFADDDIAVSITAASRAVDEITGRRFWTDSVEGERSYYPRWSKVDIDDLVDLTSVEVSSGAGSTAILSEGTDFSLYPSNALLDNRPYEALWLLRTNSYPKYSWSPPVPALVTVTGLFGWPMLPAEVVAATTILATRILRRQREAPFGILTIGIEQGAYARIAQKDPDVQNLLCNFIKPKVMIS